LTGAPPVPYAVPPTVQPTLDVQKHSPTVELYREQFSMAAGDNLIALPGYNRAAQLNPASIPTISGNGARRWLSLRIASDTALSGGDNIVFSYAVNGITHIFWQADVNFGWPADIGIGLIRSKTYWQVSTDHSQDFLLSGIENSVYCPDPGQLLVSLLSQAGTETLTVTGLYLEADSIFTPLPDPLAS
jgi:hypothetical protein